MTSRLGKGAGGKKNADEQDTSTVGVLGPLTDACMALECKGDLRERYGRILFMV